MRYEFLRFDSGRDPHTEFSVFIVVVVAACAALVAAPTLVALAYGWDYRLAVMVGAVLAVVLARLAWRALPEQRVVDRLALPLVGTLAAALFCAYASDWLDWRPLDVDDAVAGATCGLVLVLTGPIRRVLQHAARVPTAAGLAVLALALAPAGWPMFVQDEYAGVADAAARSAPNELAGLVAALGVTGLGFAFALRHRLYAAAMALSPVAWLLLLVLGARGDALLTVGVLVGGIAGAGMMTVSVNAWARSVRHIPGRLSCMPAGPLIAGARTFLVGRWRRALRAARSMVVASARNRLSRTACVASAAIGMELLLLPLLLAAPRGALAISLFFAVVASGALLLAAVAVWRASATRAPARPTGLLVFLALASAVAFLAELAPAEYFLAAAALGVWWCFYYRRGTPLVAPGAMDRLRRRQPLLRFALGTALAVTLGMHLLLLQAAVRDQTGAMVFEALAEYHLYPVSDATLARAILNDQYLWRDSVSVPEARHVDSSARRLLAKARDPRDQWSDTYFVGWWKTYERRKVTGFGVESREAPGGRGSLVSYVEGGSPAQRAGVRRGDVIRTLELVPPHLPEARRDLTRLELVSATGEVREVLVAEAEYERSAVSVERVLEVAGRKVGYVELRSFREQADEDFLHAAERLRAQGIDELVLDLRMNPGGRVLTSLRIASAIGGQRLDGKTFERLVHNERYRERDRALAFSAPARGALSLPRVFVITSGRSCSASEALINGLTPHMQVVTVGGTTCGKPVGSYTIDYGNTGFAVITFRAVNARGEGDYFDGLRPTCGADDDVRRDFGDPEEASLKAALHYIEHGRCPDPAVWL